MSRFVKRWLKMISHRHSLIDCGAVSTRGRIQVQQLEDRLTPAATLFIDYGDNFPGGTLTTTQGAFRDVANDPTPANIIIGTELDDGAGNFNAGTQLDIVAQAFTAQERARMLSVIQRAYLPLDVDVVELTAAAQMTPDGRNVAAATNMADVINTLRAGPAGSRDAYVFVATFNVDPGGANPQTYTGGGGLSPEGTVLGEQVDLGSATNTHDDVAVVYSNGGFSNNTLNNISHEAGHLLGLRHAITNATGTAATDLFHQAEIMSYRNTNNTTSSMFTRYPMIRGDGNSPAMGPNPANYNDIAARTGDVTTYDQLATDGNVLPNPNFSFVSGTGAHDIITITRNGANADVTVQAFADAGYATGITVPGEADTTFSYSFALSNSILVYAGDSNDQIIINGDLDVDVQIDGMRGNDTLIVNGMGAASATYSPNTTAPGGVDVVGGSLVTDFGGTIDIAGDSIIFSDFETAGSVTFQNVTTVTFVTPNSADNVALTSVAAGPQVSGSSGGVSFVPMVITTVANLLVDTATNDGLGTGADLVSANLTSGPTNSLEINTGAGTDTVTVNNLGGGFNVTLEVNADGGTDTLRVLNSIPAPTYTPDGTNLPSQGTLTAYGSETIEFSGFEFVTPVAPVINSMSLDKTDISEPDTVTVSVDFTDPGSLSTHSITIVWGDGTSDDVFSLPVGQRSFTRSHTYLDDNPTATPVDVNTIQVTITDNDALADSESANLTVRNVAPVITSHDTSAPSGVKAEEGEPVTVFGTFTDAGALDTHTVSIDWGDGSPVEAGTVDQLAGTYSGQHAYAGGGLYTVTIALMDDDTAVANTTETVFITGARVQTIDGKQVLFVVGTNSADQVTINQFATGKIKVLANFLDDPGHQRVFSEPIDQIRVLLCYGNDRGTIAANVTIPSLVDGGYGNDVLVGGRGPNVLLGGPGNDYLSGGLGGDILIGGDGRDRLIGTRGEDLLIGGLTAFTDGPDDSILANQTSLFAILAEYNSSRSAQTRRDNISGIANPEFGDRLNGTNFLQLGVTVTDDGDQDILTGSTGGNWFFEFANDVITDFNANQGDVIAS